MASDTGAGTPPSWDPEAGKERVKEHYQSLLGNSYTWMMGGASKNIDENRLFFEARGLMPLKPGASRAIDLGCGSGFQSVPLAQLGYAVVGVDMEPTLLKEARAHYASLASSATPSGSFEAREGDILELLGSLGAAELIVCMGDTLTHLQSMQQVRSLVRQAAQALEPGGAFILTFRDLTFHLQGTDRFLPCQADENRIFTCVLEYAEDNGQPRTQLQEQQQQQQGGADRYVVVNDLLYQRDGPRSPWTLNKSQYRKLEVPPASVLRMLEAEGLDASLDTMEFGMVAVTAHKKPSC